MAYVSWCPYPYLSYTTPHGAWFDTLAASLGVVLTLVSADGATDAVSMSLTTEDVPDNAHYLATASSIQALYPDFH